MNSGRDAGINRKSLLAACYYHLTKIAVVRSGTRWCGKPIWDGYEDFINHHDWAIGDLSYNVAYDQVARASYTNRVNNKGTYWHIGRIR
jgi:hypothetical protein